MLQQQHRYFAGLFCQERRSDCEVRFYQAGQSPPATADDPRWLGPPLPGHSLVIVPCSERLEAALDNSWYRDQESGASGSSPAAAACGQKRKHPDAGFGAAARPLLAIPLDGPQDLEPAKAVLRFMYTGSLDPGWGAVELLMARNVAEQLLFAPCAAACAAALSAASVSYEEALHICGQYNPQLDSSDLKPLLSKCGAALASRLGNVLRVMRR